MVNYILIIGIVVSFIGMSGLIFFIRNYDFYEIGKIFSFIFIVGILLSGIGILNNIGEEEKNRTDEKVENISTKIIETENTNE